MLKAAQGWIDSCVSSMTIKSTSQTSLYHLPGTGELGNGVNSICRFEERMSEDRALPNATLWLATHWNDSRLQGAKETGVEVAPRDRRNHRRLCSLLSLVSTPTHCAVVTINTLMPWFRPAESCGLGLLILDMTVCTHNVIVGHFLQTIESTSNFIRNVIVNCQDAKTS